MMSIPGLALFYGGLVRSKNMLSVLMQVFVVFSLITRCCGRSTAIQLGVHRRRRVHRRLRPAVPERAFTIKDGAASSRPRRRSARRRRSPARVLRRVPGDVRGDHRRLIVGAFAERAEVLRAAAVRGALVHVRPSPIAHMVWFWMARTPTPTDRRRRARRRPACSRRARSTSPAARSCTSTPASPASSGAYVIGKRRLRQASDGAAQPDVHDGRRRPAVGRLVRLQRRLGARGQRSPRCVRQHVPRDRRRRRDVVDGRRMDEQRRALDARRGLGRGRRSGRGHAGRRQRRPDGRVRASAPASSACGA